MLDESPPVITVPAGIVTNATGPDGAAVSYTTSAVDDVDGPVAGTCAPPTGATFAIGTTAVACAASDAAGNLAGASFDVHVKAPTEQFADLLTALTGVGPGTSLADKVIQAQTALGANHVADACSDLNALINQLTAQSGRASPRRGQFPDWRRDPDPSSTRLLAATSTVEPRPRRTGASAHPTRRSLFGGGTAADVVSVLGQRTATAIVFAQVSPQDS